MQDNPINNVLGAATDKVASLMDQNTIRKEEVPEVLETEAPGEFQRSSTTELKEQQQQAEIKTAGNFNYPAWLDSTMQESRESGYKASMLGNELYGEVRQVDGYNYNFTSEQYTANFSNTEALYQAAGITDILDDYTGWYESNGNEHPQGWEDVGNMQIKREQITNSFHNEVVNGDSTKEQWLMKEFGLEILQEAGYDITEAAYWASQGKEGSFETPFQKDPTLFATTLQVAEYRLEQFGLSELITNVYSAVNVIDIEGPGTALDKATANNIFKQRIADVAKGVGSQAETAARLRSGHLDVDRVIYNKEGKATYYLDMDFKVKELVEDDSHKNDPSKALVKYNDDGSLHSILLDNGEEALGIESAAKGFVKGAWSLVEGLGTLVSVAAEGIDWLWEEMIGEDHDLDNQMLGWQVWSNGFANTNQMMATDIVKFNSGNDYLVNDIAGGVGYFGGMLAGMFVTAGIAGAASKAGSAMGAASGAGKLGKAAGYAISKVADIASKTVSMSAGAPTFQSMNLIGATLESVSYIAIKDYTDTYSRLKLGQSQNGLNDDEINSSALTTAAGNAVVSFFLRSVNGNNNMLTRFAGSSIGQKAVEGVDDVATKAATQNAFGRFITKHSKAAATIGVTADAFENLWTMTASNYANSTGGTLYKDLDQAMTELGKTLSDPQMLTILALTSGRQVKEEFTGDYNSVSDMVSGVYTKYIADLDDKLKKADPDKAASINAVKNALMMDSKIQGDETPIEAQIRALGSLFDNNELQSTNIKNIITEGIKQKKVEDLQRRYELSKAVLMNTHTSYASEIGKVIRGESSISSVFTDSIRGRLEGYLLGINKIDQSTMQKIQLIDPEKANEIAFSKSLQKSLGVNTVKVSENNLISSENAGIHTVFEIVNDAKLTKEIQDKYGEDALASVNPNSIVIAPKFAGSEYDGSDTAKAVTNSMKALSTIFGEYAEQTGTESMFRVVGKPNNNDVLFVINSENPLKAMVTAENATNFINSYGELIMNSKLTKEQMTDHLKNIQATIFGTTDLNAQDIGAIFNILVDNNYLTLKDALAISDNITKTAEIKIDYDSLGSSKLSKAVDTVAEIEAYNKSFGNAKKAHASKLMNKLNREDFIDVLDALGIDKVKLEKQLGTDMTTNFLELNTLPKTGTSEEEVRSNLGLYNQKIIDEENKQKQSFVELVTKPSKRLEDTLTKLGVDKELQQDFIKDTGDLKVLRDNELKSLKDTYDADYKNIVAEFGDTEEANLKLSELHSKYQDDLKVVQDTFDENYSDRARGLADLVIDVKTAYNAELENTIKVFKGNSETNPDPYKMVISLSELVPHDLRVIFDKANQSKIEFDNIIKLDPKAFFSKFPGVSGTIVNQFKALSDIYAKYRSSVIVLDPYENATDITYILSRLGYDTKVRDMINSGSGKGVPGFYYSRGSEFGYKFKSSANLEELKPLGITKVDQFADSSTTPVDFVESLKDYSGGILFPVPLEDLELDLTKPINKLIVDIDVENETNASFDMVDLNVSKLGKLGNQTKSLMAEYRNAVALSGKDNEAIKNAVLTEVLHTTLLEKFGDTGADERNVIIVNKNYLDSLDPSYKNFWDIPKSENAESDDVILVFKESPSYVSDGQQLSMSQIFGGMLLVNASTEVVKAPMILASDGESLAIQRSLGNSYLANTVAALKNITIPDDPSGALNKYILDVATNKVQDSLYPTFKDTNSLTGTMKVVDILNADPKELSLMDAIILKYAEAAVEIYGKIENDNKNLSNDLQKLLSNDEAITFVGNKFNEVHEGKTISYEDIADEVNKLQLSDKEMPGEITKSVSNKDINTLIVKDGFNVTAKDIQDLFLIMSRARDIFNANAGFSIAVEDSQSSLYAKLMVAGSNGKDWRLSSKVLATLSEEELNVLYKFTDAKEHRDNLSKTFGLDEVKPDRLDAKAVETIGPRTVTVDEQVTNKADHLISKLARREFAREHETEYYKLANKMENSTKASEYMIKHMGDVEGLGIIEAISNPGKFLVANLDNKMVLAETIAVKSDIESRLKDSGIPADVSARLAEEYVIRSYINTDQYNYLAYYVVDAEGRIKDRLSTSSAKDFKEKKLFIESLDSLKEGDKVFYFEPNNKDIKHTVLDADKLSKMRELLVLKAFEKDPRGLAELSKSDSDSKRRDIITQSLENYLAYDRDSFESKRLMKDMIYTLMTKGKSDTIENKDYYESIASTIAYGSFDMLDPALVTNNTITEGALEGLFDNVVHTIANEVKGETNKSKKIILNLSEYGIDYNALPTKVKEGVDNLQDAIEFSDIYSSNRGLVKDLYKAIKDSDSLTKETISVFKELDTESQTKVFNDLISSKIEKFKQADTLEMLALKDSLKDSELYNKLNNIHNKLFSKDINASEYSAFNILNRPELNNLTLFRLNSETLDAYASIRNLESSEINYKIVRSEIAKSLERDRVVVDQRDFASSGSDWYLAKVFADTISRLPDTYTESDGTIKAQYVLDQISNALLQVLENKSYKEHFKGNKDLFNVIRSNPEISEHFDKVLKTTMNLKTSDVTIDNKEVKGIFKNYLDNDTYNNYMKHSQDAGISNMSRTVTDYVSTLKNLNMPSDISSEISRQLMTFYSTDESGIADRKYSKVIETEQYTKTLQAISDAVDAYTRKYDQVYLYAHSLPVGQDLKLIDGSVKQMEVNDLVVPTKQAKTLLGIEDDRVLAKTTKSGEIFVKVIRHPGDTVDSIGIYKLIVSDDVDSVHMSKDMMLTINNGDFDGDSISIVKPDLSDPSNTVLGLISDLRKDSYGLLNNVIKHSKAPSSDVSDGNFSKALHLFQDEDYVNLLVDSYSDITSNPKEFDAAKSMFIDEVKNMHPEFFMDMDVEDVDSFIGSLFFTKHDVSGSFTKHKEVFTLPFLGELPISKELKTNSQLVKLHTNMSRGVLSLADTMIGTMQKFEGYQTFKSDPGTFEDVVNTFTTKPIRLDSETYSIINKQTVEHIAKQLSTNKQAEDLFIRLTDAGFNNADALTYAITKAQHLELMDKLSAEELDMITSLAGSIRPDKAIEDARQLLDNINSINDTNITFESLVRDPKAKESLARQIQDKLSEEFEPNEANAKLDFQQAMANGKTVNARVVSMDLPEEPKDVIYVSESLAKNSGFVTPEIYSVDDLDSIKPLLSRVSRDTFKAKNDLNLVNSKGKSDTIAKGTKVIFAGDSLIAFNNVEITGFTKLALYGTLLGKTPNVKIKSDDEITKLTGSSGVQVVVNDSNFKPDKFSEGFLSTLSNVKKSGTGVAFDTQLAIAKETSKWKSVEGSYSRVDDLMMGRNQLSITSLDVNGSRIAVKGSEVNGDIVYTVDTSEAAKLMNTGKNVDYTMRSVNAASDYFMLKGLSLLSLAVEAGVEMPQTKIDMIAKNLVGSTGRSNHRAKGWLTTLCNMFDPLVDAKRQEILKVFESSGITNVRQEFKLNELSEENKVVVLETILGRTIPSNVKGLFSSELEAELKNTRASRIIGDPSTQSMQGSKNKSNVGNQKKVYKSATEGIGNQYQYNQLASGKPGLVYNADTYLSKDALFRHINGGYPVNVDAIKKASLMKTIPTGKSLRGNQATGFISQDYKDTSYTLDTVGRVEDSPKQGSYVGSFFSDNDTDYAVPRDFTNVELDTSKNYSSYLSDADILKVPTKYSQAKSNEYIAKLMANIKEGTPEDASLKVAGYDGIVLRDSITHHKNSSNKYSYSNEPVPNKPDSYFRFSNYSAIADQRLKTMLEQKVDTPEGYAKQKVKDSSELNVAADKALQGRVAPDKTIDKAELSISKELADARASLKVQDFLSDEPKSKPDIDFKSYDIKNDVFNEPHKRDILDNTQTSSKTRAGMIMSKSLELLGQRGLNRHRVEMLGDSGVSFIHEVLQMSPEVRKQFNEYTRIKSAYNSKDPKAIEKIQGFNKAKAEAYIKDYESRFPYVVSLYDKTVDNLMNKISDFKNRGHNYINISDLQALGDDLTASTKVLMSSISGNKLSAGSDKGDYDYLNNLKQNVNALAKQMARLEFAQKMFESGHTNNLAIRKTAGEILDSMVGNYKISKIESTDGSKGYYMLDAEGVNKLVSNVYSNVSKIVSEKPMHSTAEDNLKQLYQDISNELVKRDSNKTLLELHDSNDPADIEYLNLIESLDSLRQGILSSDAKAVDTVAKDIKKLTDGGKYTLVTKDCRIIDLDDHGNAVVRPADATDATYIRESVTITTDLFASLINGDVFLMESSKAKFINDRYYTTKVPSNITKALRNVSQVFIKLVMSPPWKVVSNMLKFTTTDIGILSVFGPAEVMSKMPSTVREVRQFFKTDGQVGSADFKEYARLTGIDPNQENIDPIFYEQTAPTRFKAMNKYFDTTARAYEQQTMVTRYVAYKTVLDSLRKAEETGADTAKWGTSYRYKDAMEGMALEEKALRIVDNAIGGPGGFPGIAREVNPYLIFMTYPLAINRFVIDLVCSSGKAAKDLNIRGLSAPLGGLGLNMLIMGLVTTLAQETNQAYSDYDYEEDEFNEENSDFTSRLWKNIKDGTMIDPFLTMMTGGYVPAYGMYATPMHAFKENWLDAFTDPNNKSMMDKGMGFATSQVLSHINPAFKMPFEIVTGKDVYGTSIKETNPIFDMQDRFMNKVLALFMGTTGAREFTEKMKLTGDYSDMGFMDRLIESASHAFTQETWNSKTYKHDTRNYYAATDFVNAYIASQYDSGDDYDYFNDKDRLYSAYETYKAENSLANKDEIDKLYKMLRTAIDNREKPIVIKNIVLQNVVNKNTRTISVESARVALDKLSIMRKMNKIQDIDAFYASLSDREAESIREAIKYEMEYFPEIYDMLPETKSARKLYSNYNSPYSLRRGGSSYSPRSSVGYSPTIYPRNVYINTPYMQRYYPKGFNNYTKANTFRGSSYSKRNKYKNDKGYYIPPFMVKNLTKHTGRNPDTKLDNLDFRIDDGSKSTYRAKSQFQRTSPVAEQEINYNQYTPKGKLPYYEGGDL